MKLSAAVESPGFWGTIGNAAHSAFDNTVGRGVRMSLGGATGLFHGGVGLGAKALSYVPGTTGEVANAFGNKSLETAGAGLRTVAHLGGRTGTYPLDSYARQEVTRMNNAGSTGMAHATAWAPSAMRATEYASPLTAGARTGALAVKGLGLASGAAVPAMMFGEPIKNMYDQARGTGQYSPEGRYDSAITGMASPSFQQRVQSAKPEQLTDLLKPHAESIAPYLDQVRGLAPGTTLAKLMADKQLTQPELDAEVYGKPPAVAESPQSQSGPAGGSANAAASPWAGMDWKKMLGGGLGLFGLLQLLQGKGGISPLLMTLLGGGLATNGFGMFGGEQQPVKAPATPPTPSATNDAAMAELNQAAPRLQRQ